MSSTGACCVAFPLGGLDYRCIYWDEDARLCGAYQHRPAMCRDYQYPLTAGGVCEHGCAWGAPLL